MEKIILKPTAKELIYKSGEENVYFDVYSYYGSTNQERNLGALFVIGHIKYADEDLSYLISLASSLAKREYYSEKSLQEQNPKEAFGRSLRKLNEVLNDFFQNKNFKLNIGLFAIVSENIFISRLGKFKINLARNGQLIDILNNIELFKKDTEGEKQFSNIISGKLQAGDKIFAFFPSRSITSRERHINTILIKEDQEGFGQKIDQLAASASNFSFCGVHIDMLQVKEMPFQFKPKDSSYSLPAQPLQTPLKTGVENKRNQVGSPILTIASQNKSEIEKPSNAEVSNRNGENKMPEQPRIIPAEFSITKRSNIFTRTAAQLEKLKLFSRADKRKGGSFFILAVLTAIIASILLISFKNISGSQTKNALVFANEKLKSAQIQLSQNNKKEARKLLQEALDNISNLPVKESEKIRNEINKILTGIDQVSEKKPNLFSDSGNQIKNNEFMLLTVSGDSNNLNVVASSGALFYVSSNSLTETGRLGIKSKFLFGSKTVVAAFDGAERVAVLSLKSKNISSYSLKKPVSSLDAAFYENNLYVLSENRIYKYADALSGNAEQSEWINDSSSGKLTALTVDGNIFALNDDGKLIKYFKGKKLTEIDLQIYPSAGSKIFTTKNSAFLYLADKINKKVYVFDKSGGELKTSYDLSPTGQIQDISISQAGTIWVLSKDNKIWQIQP
jgi:hypothetical protein